MVRRYRLGRSLALPGASPYPEPRPTRSLALPGASPYLEPRPTWSLDLYGASTYMEPLPIWSLYLEPRPALRTECPFIERETISPRFVIARRLDVLDEIFSISGDARKPSGPPCVLPRQAEKVYARYRGDPTMMAGIPFSVENRQLDPAIIRVEADTPDDGGDARGDIVELQEFRLRLPERLVT
jgi:hypothetical protein